MAAGRAACVHARPQAHVPAAASSCIGLRAVLQALSVTCILHSRFHCHPCAVPPPVCGRGCAQRKLCMAHPPPPPPPVTSPHSTPPPCRRHRRRGNNNVYKMPVLLYLFGEEQHRARVVAKMRAAGKLLSDPTLPLGSPGGGSSGRGGASPSSAAAAAAVPLLSQQKMEDSIDRLFDGEAEVWRGALAGVPAPGMLATCKGAGDPAGTASLLP